MVYRRAAEFEESVIDISTPDHHHYGKHLTRHQLGDFLRSDAKAIKDIEVWLVSQSVQPENIELGSRNWLSFKLTVGQAERLLNTQFYFFHNAAANITHIRTLQYSVPIHIRTHIQMIQPTTRFGSQIHPEAIGIMRAEKVTFLSIIPNGYNAAFRNNTTTPECLRDPYGLGSAAGSPNVKFGIAGFLNQYARHSDLPSS
jgi:tripeptidyl-peptidase-1